MAKKDEVLEKILASKGPAPQEAQAQKSVTPPSGPDLVTLQKRISELEAESEQLKVGFSVLQHRNSTLLDLLERIRPHIAARNGIGEVSKYFCVGCRGGHKKNCPMPQILAEIGE